MNLTEGRGGGGDRSYVFILNKILLTKVNRILQLDKSCVIITVMTV